MNLKSNYRAYNANEKKLIYTFDQYQIYSDEVTGKLYCGGHNDKGEWEELPLMRNSGKVDLGGRDIFEKDVVSLNHNQKGSFKIGIVEYDTENDEFIVINSHNKKIGILSDEISSELYVFWDIYSFGDIIDSKK